MSIVLLSCKKRKRERKRKKEMKRKGERKRKNGREMLTFLASIYQICQIVGIS
jgi:hypothetical protein